MNNRETRRFLNRELVESTRLRKVAGQHPIMGPLLEQREHDFRNQIKHLPLGVPEPRAVLFFTGDPVYGSKGIDAKFASTILQPFLEMVKTEYATEKHGKVGERGPRKDESESRLLITGMPRGSFGIELSQPQTEDLFGEQRMSDILIRLTSLLASAGKSDEDFEHALHEVSPRVYGRLGEFFTALHDNKAKLRLQTGDLEFSLTQEDISQAVDRVAAVKTVEQTELKQGTFRGAVLDTWKFDFRTDSNENISGKIASELDEHQVTEMLPLTNHPCIAELREFQINTKSGAIRTRYELLGLKKSILPRRKKSRKGL